MRKIGILFESQSDIMSNRFASVETHYHWRETEEVEAVATNLKALGYDVDLIGTLDALLEKWRQNQLPEFIWNLSVRTTSRNRTALAPAILEQLGIPYTGGDATVKSLTLNKDFLKPVLQWRGILTPSWLRYGVGEEIVTPPWEKCILKPACEGYSLGLQLWEASAGLAELQDKVKQLHQQFESAVLCEQFISGREITVGVVGNDAPVFIGAVETVTTEGKPLEPPSTSSSPRHFAQRGQPPHASGSSPPSTPSMPNPPRSLKNIAQSYRDRNSYQQVIWFVAIDLYCCGFWGGSCSKCF